MKGRPPGLVRADTNPDVVMMICTAGHVDHGKTRLVKLLTGCETDRLKEERERGLTIELGFAPCSLGGDLCVGIVDVPGHEKFVRNMVAGISGIELAILVIAADDGIMPQTLEHFQILELLGVRHGIVALTKIDRVASERVDEIRRSVEAQFAGTFLEGAPILPLSSVTGEGYGEFYEALVERIRAVARMRKRGIFRQPIERVFTREGFGTIATGVCIDGTVRVGDTVEIVPGGGAARIRGIQRFLRDTDEGGFGQCLALNLNLVESGNRPVERGQVIATPGYLAPASIFHVRIRSVAGIDPPIRNAESVKLHVGTSERSAKLYLARGGALAPGESGWATLVAGEEVAASAHDRCILRRTSPAVTIGGGEILAVVHAGGRPSRKRVALQLEAYEAALGGEDPGSAEGLRRRIAYHLRTERPNGASLADVAREVLLPQPDAREILAGLERDGAVLAIGSDTYLHREAHEACRRLVEDRILEAIGADVARSVPVGEVRKGLDWSPALWERIQGEIVGAGRFGLRDGRFHARASAADLPEDERRLRDRILRTYEETGCRSPRPDELPDLLGAPSEKTDRLVEHLCNEGELLRLARNVVLARSAFKRAQDGVVRTLREKGELDSAEFKHHIDSTRKYALAILDALDARRVTVRIGNLRKLAPNHERNLL